MLGYFHIHMATGLMDLCAELATAGEAPGWTNLFTRDWIKIDWREVGDDSTGGEHVG